MNSPAILALADGTLFRGESIGAPGRAVGEVVFNTSITGYQEILTDPSYCRQIITLTYPHIGNVGVNAADDEAATVHASGLVIRDLSRVTSNWRSERSLNVFLQDRGVVGIAGIDTRRLTRILRDRGAQNGCIVNGGDIDEKAAVEAAQGFGGLEGMDLAEAVSTRNVYQWHEGRWSFEHDTLRPALQGGRLPVQDSPASPWHVVAYDFGIKRNIMRLLVTHGCRVTVVPARTTAEEALSFEPDGVFLSNGPGDPEPCDYAIEAVRKLIATGVPIFGICLGHQLLALACGASTKKMKFGHHGANHPVKDLATGAVLITSQNHGFAVDEASLPANVQPTHRSLFDGSLQGIHLKDRPAFGFQGHPEASPGPHEAGSLFGSFLRLMEKTAFRSSGRSHAEAY